MYMTACGNGLPGVADGVPVFDYIISGGQIRKSCFVPERDIVQQADGLAARLADGALL